MVEPLRGQADHDRRFHVDPRAHSPPKTTKVPFATPSAPAQVPQVSPGKGITVDLLSCLKDTKLVSYTFMHWKSRCSVDLVRGHMYDILTLWFIAAGSCAQRGH